MWELYYTILLDIADALMCMWHFTVAVGRGGDNFNFCLYFILQQSDKHSAVKSSLIPSEL